MTAKILTIAKVKKRIYLTGITYFFLLTSARPITKVKIKIGYAKSPKVPSKKYLIGEINPVKSGMKQNVDNTKSAIPT